MVFHPKPWAKSGHWRFSRGFKGVLFGSLYIMPKKASLCSPEAANRCLNPKSKGDSHRGGGRAASSLGLLEEAGRVGKPGGCLQTHRPVGKGLSAG